MALYLNFSTKTSKCIAEINQSNGSWADVDEGSLDTVVLISVSCHLVNRSAFLQNNGDLAMEVAFRGALTMENDLQSASMRVARDLWRLCFICDGWKSYGHHHRRGEMALAYCFQTLDTMEGIEPINYATIYRFPPTKRVQFMSPLHGLVFMVLADGQKIVDV